ncbi:uncharacterized protein B0H64DRAFT_438843 [Chaetomium fimeti]|uniref:Uncharacterized protein n=1 Tax=Chaetomium fimeti TaxID=1854472 RepID=A0AAE0LUV5_9PEZI|nr:hypothetical protein B0H64DRAFT_438843 [Chaetomium fimeti]
MAYSDRHRALDPYDVFEYARQPQFWLLGAALIANFIATTIFISHTAKAKADEESQGTLPSHNPKTTTTPQPAQPAHQPDNDDDDDTTKEEAPHPNPDPPQPAAEQTPTRPALPRRCTRWLAPHLTTKWHTALAVAVYLAILGAQLQEGVWVGVTFGRVLGVMSQQWSMWFRAGSWLGTGVYGLLILVLALLGAGGAYLGALAVALQFNCVVELCFCA